MLKHSCFLLANINNINNTVKQQAGSADNSLMLQFQPFMRFGVIPIFVQ